MNPKLAALLSLVAERVARTHPGSAFSMPEAAGTCAHPERLTFVAGRLHWLSPLDRLTKDEQRALGLMASSSRPAAEADESEGELVEDLDGEMALAPEFSESERHAEAETLVAP